MAKELKQLVVEEMTRRYADVDHCVVVNYSGVTSATAVEIRKQLRQHGIELAVVKNSLMARAFANVGLESIVGLLDGPCALATGGEDLVELTKAVTEVADKRKGVVIRGGYGAGEELDAGDVRRVAAIPPRLVLIGSFLNVALRPLTAMAGTMNAFVGNVVRVLDAVAKKK